MILGIDIGGTHTDAVCIHEGEIVDTAKAVTGSDLVVSIMEVIDALDIDYTAIRRVVLSTTLSTNAIIQKIYPLTGMIISAGPGIDPRNFFLTDDFFMVDGAMDHRGREYIPLNRDQVVSVAGSLKKTGVEGVGVVSKFSVRNPSHETAICSMIEKDFKCSSMGHSISGSLDFPRRIHTTYLNTAVMPLQKTFVDAVKNALNELGINAPLLFLKADGGTFSSSAADRLPVETILSGPAASMMGALALNGDKSSTTLVLDVGGTTTDIGILLKGVPIFEPKGLDISGVKTLVRGLKVLSVGSGGDSCVRINNDRICVGPIRHGPPVALGGDIPTPMDAFALLGGFAQGDPEMACRAISEMACELRRDEKAVAEEIISTMVKNIKNEVDAFIEEINSHPVYTIYEMLHPDIVRPDRIMVVGGPAMLLKPYIEKAFSLECIVPDNFMVANALGAALAKTTTQITLLADTHLDRLICPELGIEEEAPQLLSLQDLRSMGEKAIKENAAYLGLSDDFDVSVIEEQSFNIVRGFSTAGRNMRVKMQTRPGIISQWRGQ